MEKIAKPLGVSFVQAIWGIHDLINETMAAAAKTHIAEKGREPQRSSRLPLSAAQARFTLTALPRSWGRRG